MQIAVEGRTYFKLIIDLLVRVFMNINFVIYYVLGLFYLWNYGVGTIYIIYTLPIAIYAYIFSTVIHEFGHLFFGKCVGFELFRIGFPLIILFKTKGKWNINLNRGGNSYCYMRDKKASSDIIQYILYYAGGCFGNFFCVILGIITRPQEPLINLLWLGVIIYSAGKGTSNIIPNMKKIYSDGSVIRCLQKEKNNMNLIRVQMAVNEKIQMGMDLKEFNIFNEVDEIKKETDLSFFVHMVNYYIYLDRAMYLKAETEIRSLEEKLKFYSLNSQQQFLVEKLFIYSIQNKVEAKTAYDEMMMQKPQHNFDFYCAVYCYLKFREISFEYVDQIELMLKNYIEHCEANEYMRIKERILFD